MKKAIVLFVIASVLSVSLFAQTKKDSVPALPQYNDSLQIISVSDLEPLYKKIRSTFTYDQAEPLVKWMENLVATKVAEYQAKQKAVPAKHK
jgi:hypothetical protein